MENMEINAKMEARVAMNTTKAYASDLAYIQQWAYLTLRRCALDISVKGRAAQALRDWMRVAAIKQGAIFRAVNKCGRVSDNPLSPIDVNRIVKNRCKAVGLNEKQFGAHSLRSGFLTQGAID